MLEFRAKSAMTRYQSGHALQPSDVNRLIDAILAEDPTPAGVEARAERAEFLLALMAACAREFYRGQHLATLQLIENAEVAWSRTSFAEAQLSALQAREKVLVEALAPFATFDLSGFDGVVLEVVPSSADNPAPRIEPILKQHFELARAAHELLAKLIQRRREQP